MPRFLIIFLLAWTSEKGAAEENFVSIWPENPVVEFGGSIVLNCSGSGERIGLETAFTRRSIAEGPNWKAFQLTNISSWTAGPLCFINSEDQTKYARAKIVIYKPPESIELDPVPKMEVSKQYNVTCQISRVAPIRNLTVTLWKGTEQVLVKTFENHAKPEDDDVVVTHLLTAQRNHHKEEVSCQATLDLSPRGPLLNYTSPSISLESFDFQVDPQLQADSFLEVGSEMMVSCDASGISPPEEATFDLTFAGKALPFNTSVTGEQDASAQALVTSSLVGEQELVCRVSLGPVSKEVKKTVTVFDVPKLILQTDASEVVVDQMVNITCSASGNVSRGLKMQIWNANQMLASSSHDSHLVQHAIITRKEDNGREIICQMILRVDGYAKERRTSQKLTVFYGPRMDNSSCPPRLNWKEGKWELFTCSASGNPIPTVQCWKDGRSYLPGVQQKVKREHNGIYYCNATNQYGSEIRNVTIHVETSQTNIFVIVVGTLAVLIFIFSVGMAVFCNSRKKMGIYYLWRRQPPPSQATGMSKQQNCLNSTTNI